MPTALMTGLTDPFMVPYALALGAGAFQAGLLNAARNLIMSLSQLATVGLAKRLRSRKRLVLCCVGLQALLWIPVALVRPAFGGAAVAALILLYTLGSSASSLAGPAWGSIVSEYLPPEKRGAFFGRRDMRIALAVGAAGLAGGGVLDLLDGRTLLGFGILCGSAAVLRGISWSWLARLHDSPWQGFSEPRVRFMSFLRRARTENFPRFTVCFGLFSFSVHLTVPYLTVYMFEELRYSYLTYSMVALAGTMLGSLLIPRWGRIADAWGSRVVLRVTMAAACVMPLLWAVSPEPFWLMIMHLVGGFFWGGLNLASVNFVYDAAPPATRVRFLAYFNVIHGSCASLGTFAGGWLLTVLPPFGGSVFFSLFFLSATLRAASALGFSLLVREVRPVTQVGLREVVLDLIGRRMIQVLGYFSVRPEDERRAGDGPERGNS